MASDFRFSRSTTIDAPPTRVHALLDDFHEWRRWSPWESLDGEMERTYDGPRSGVGAVYAWRGDRKAGEGRMEVLESEAERVVVDLHFKAPMTARNRVEFTLAPAAAGGTHVEWVMTGPQNLVMRLMNKLWSMDRMLGPDFERGLSRLKTAAES